MNGPPVPTHPRQDGFSLIELIVVLIIISILMAVAIPHFLGARKTSMHRQVAAAANSYAEAIESFRLDHGGRPPQLGDQDEWPTAQVADGPQNSLTHKHYMRLGAPDVVHQEIATIGGDGVRTGGRMTKWHIDYSSHTTPPYSWTLRVSGTDPHDDYTCELTSGATATGVTKC